ncbi:MAG: RusA family crossover junction endodeoxyribonuclease [Planctomycetota bacterium]
MGRRILTFEIPWPPSVNRYWRCAGNRTYLTHDARRYRDEVRAAIPRTVESMTGELEVDLILLPPDARRRDIDNSLKAILDALESAGVYADDSQVARLSVERGQVCPGGRVLVEIERMQVQDAA